MTSLALDHNRLSGRLPNSLFANLVHLRVLSLSDNRITGCVPDAVGRLSALEVLNLRANILFGTVPLSVGTLPHLKRLLLEDNELNAPIPHTAAGQLSKSI